MLKTTITDQLSLLSSVVYLHRFEPFFSFFHTIIMSIRVNIVTDILFFTMKNGCAIKGANNLFISNIPHYIYKYTSVTIAVRL